MQSQAQGQTGGLRGALAGYDPAGHFCELEHGAGASTHGGTIRSRLDALGIEELTHRARAAEAELYNQGITFTIYSEGDAIDRILPFDVIPRLITAADWAIIESGVRQRVQTLNLFLADVYGPQKVLKDGLIPAELVLGNANYRAEMQGLTLPHHTYVHINGTDLVRDREGRFRVLEDNGRSPSGVSYVVENRHLMLRSFSDLMRDLPVRPVSDYGRQLHEKLSEVAPEGILDPQVVLLSPGVFNSAYFEHAFLARQMGVELVEGRDLLVNDNVVYTRTTSGLKRIDVIYRRIDDDFIDPLIFREDSALGVPGLFNAYRAGNVMIANALGTGVADDKAVYAYVPRLIRYYLAEEPILDNVETFLCREEKSLSHVLANLDKLVVKAVGESGGYGMLVGPHASQAERDDFAQKIKADPENYIAQPTIQLSTAPTFIGSGVEARHVDLRPFILHGAETKIVPGALTRVALKRGSLVVNSSQGGGSKDTWVLSQ